MLQSFREPYLDCPLILAILPRARRVTPMQKASPLFLAPISYFEGGNSKLDLFYFVSHILSTYYSFSFFTILGQVDLLSNRITIIKTKHQKYHQKEAI